RLGSQGSQDSDRTASFPLTAIFPPSAHRRGGTLPSWTALQRGTAAPGRYTTCMGWAATGHAWSSVADLAIRLEATRRAGRGGGCWTASSSVECATLYVPMMVCLCRSNPSKEKTHLS